MTDGEIIEWLRMQEYTVKAIRDRWARVACGDDQGFTELQLADERERYCKIIRQLMEMRDEAFEASAKCADYWGAGKWRVEDEPGRSRYTRHDLQTYTNLAGRGIAEDIRKLRRASPSSDEEPQRGDTDSQHGDKTNDT